MAIYLPSAVSLANKVESHYNSGYQPGRWNSVKLADNEINPEQRYYDVEFVQASEKLAELIPNDVAASDWYEFLISFMGHRIVEMPICSYSQRLDTVTRKCVDKRDKAPPSDDKTWYPPPTNGSYPPQDAAAPPPAPKKPGYALPLAIIGVVAILLLTGGGK